MPKRYTCADLLAKPNLMPNQVWARPLTEDEHVAIGEWEDRYIEARGLFEAHDARAKDSFDQFKGAIDPDQYLKWLRQATYRYMRRNEEHLPPHLQTDTKILRTELVGLSDVKHPRHGEVALTVARHGDRITGSGRGRITDGDRVHLHHTPTVWSIKGKVTATDATSVGIGDGLHRQLHQARDVSRLQETLAEQVDGDFDWLRPRMIARGYTMHEVWRARERAHQLNAELGLYDRSEGRSR